MIKKIKVNIRNTNKINNINKKIWGFITHLKLSQRNRWALAAAIKITITVEYLMRWLYLTSQKLIRLLSGKISKVVKALQEKIH